MQSTSNSNCMPGLMCWALQYQCLCLNLEVERFLLCVHTRMELGLVIVGLKVDNRSKGNLRWCCYKRYGQVSQVCEYEQASRAGHDRRNTRGVNSYHANSTAQYMRRHYNSIPL